MPPVDKPVAALKWLVPQLLKDLGQAKLWPVRLAGVKNQESLRALPSRSWQRHFVSWNVYVCVCACVR